ncbi:uncharacterized protein LOC106082319 [Stomoxys calcitrans]|uniref:Ionotropic glutamate receptor L-glutamate and glycine-binding domain-containing protein n=1 Tax=Stomoxys calcitrans TaxID=35570 RepID=A0A1I8PA69_STOCA|nr:uncharacterized protein LOC106082319 [Stomoxys calcitrans]
MDTIRSPFYEEIPNAFSFEENFRLGSQLVGPYAKILENFAHYHNYKLGLISLENYNVSHIQLDIQQGVYNLSMLGGTNLNLFANITFSYPLEWSRVCVMVPSEKELPHYWYVFWPLGVDIWILLGLGVPYVAVLMSLLKYPSVSFLENLLESFALLLFYSNACCKLDNIPSRCYTVHLLFLPFGFVLFNYYTIYLTAYNFRPVFQPFLKTLENILASKISIMVPSHILEELQNNPKVNLTPLNAALVEKALPEVAYMLRNFSQTHAIVITQSQWGFIKRLQRDLVQPLYQLSDVCFGNSHYTFPMQLDSRFASALDDFILLVQQSGLWGHWQEEAFIAAHRMKHYKILHDVYPIRPLDMEYYWLTWMVLVIGIALSCMCLVVEIIVGRRKKPKFHYVP